MTETTEKVALVTGASKGIGKACAMVLASQGYRVAIHFRSNPELAKAVQAELPGSEIFQFDLSEDGACEALIKEVTAKMGGIDVLVNNAGISIDQLITFAKITDFDKILSTNLRPVFLLSKLASKKMIRKKSGSIVNITSVVGHTGNAGQSMYTAAKSAVTGLTKSMAVDLAGFGIRANCVAPGFIATDMTDALPEDVQDKILEGIPLKRLGDAKDIGEAVAFLASDKAKYITGTTLHVNGGMARF